MLRRISSKQKLAATLLPVRTVGVQGDCRTYSYAAGISSERDPDWDDMIFLAKLIPRICHNINRVCYIFGGIVKEFIPDLTPTYLTSNVLSTLRQCDDIATGVSVCKFCVKKKAEAILFKTNCAGKLGSYVATCFSK